MQQNAEKFVNLMVDILQKGVENVPPYVSNLLFRYSMMNLTYVIIGVILLVIAIIAGKKMTKFDPYDDWAVPYAIVALLCFLIGIMLIGDSLQNIFIPELGIISLLKNGR